MGLNRIAVLMTSFNRRELTLRSLQSLFSQSGAEGSALSVYLVDDGSRDGTADAVREQFPAVNLLSGDGKLFWNGGMRKAFAAAMADDFDAYIWFNDDTELVPGALARLLQCMRESDPQYGPAIIAASVQDGPAGAHAYGGFVRQAHGLRLDFVLFAAGSLTGVAV